MTTSYLLRCGRGTAVAANLATRRAAIGCRVRSAHNHGGTLRRCTGSLGGSAVAGSGNERLVRLPQLWCWQLKSSAPMMLQDVHPFRAYSTSRMLSQDDFPPHTIFPMPALSPTMDSGTIQSWNMQEGQEFRAGDVLCAIETDKASVDFEAQDDGILAKILQGTGTEVSCGVPICVVVEDADDVAAFANYVAEQEGSAGIGASASSNADDAATPTTSSGIGSGTGPSPPTPEGRTVAFEFVLLPSARHLAESKGLDATGLTGSGKGGRITKGDILKALADGVELPALQKKTQAAAAPAESANPSSAASSSAPVSHRQAAASAPKADLPAPTVDNAGPYEDMNNSKMRKIIASRLTESKRNVPHYYTSVTVELDQVMQLRKRLASQHEVKVSVNDFVIRACALALRDVPAVNAMFDVKQNTVQTVNNIDISVAVATPTGLITPILFGTDKMGLSELTNTVKDLAVRARDGKLAPHEYQGGTFSVSNLGMFGINEFSAVINPPQAAILAVGGGARTLVATPYVDGAITQAPPHIKNIMTARLSADRRVVDEATAAQFLEVFRYMLQEPELTLL